MTSAATVGIVLYLLVVVIVAFALYWIIRLAVRHGIRDTRKQPPAERTDGFPGAPGPSR
ncbi:hypothetical protein SAMN04489806_2934 [Paramicrobacterium humi]|uniref:Uncharacterized protein n=1 Tax=Paramicrobacterium humi TaxID=640635 RepID=A0A1H4QWH3_9MICO|nr:hypothetical protein [Microbacterium humi]SEC23888.1 hypothetical protein SAMN04489806_2934 [Microbacterium humi]